MKLDTTPQDVAVCGNFETSAFGMEASAHAFDIIADKIYTHKVRAVIREISCNAHDAHIEAGNPEPFDVHLPTRLEPFFCVRDRGVGLSDDDVRFVFCNTFKSTKQHTNDQIGCLGLGSKSPFCLTDSFTVKSWYGGMCRTYSCYRDDQRKPNVALLTEIDSDEPNGLEISFSIEDKSYEFQEDAVKVFRHWSYTPNINNKEVVKNIEEKRKQYKFVGEDFGLSADYGSMKAIMGNVAYDIPDELDEFDVDGYIRFELGEISFDAGRESLSLDDRTKAVIKAKFKSVKDKLTVEASQQIDDLPTEWERANLAYDLSLGQLGRLVRTDLTKYSLPETSKEMVYFSRSYRTVDKGETTRLPLGNEIAYYESKPRFQTRIRNWIKDQYTTKSIVLLTQQQITETGIDPNVIQNLDDLPKIIYSTGQTGSTVKTFTFDRVSGWRDRDYWSENESEVDGSEMVYIEINRFQPAGSSSGRVFGLSSNNEIKRTFEKLNATGIEVPVLHGLKSVYLNTKAFKNGNYIALNDYVEREVKKIAPDSRNSYDSEDFAYMERLNEHITGVSELELWAEMRDGHKPALLELVRMIHLDLEEDTLIQELHDEFFAAYPMIKLISRWDLGNKDALSIIADYIGGRVNEDRKKEN